jgi:hypothetical protein
LNFQGCITVYLSMYIYFLPPPARQK